VCLCVCLCVVCVCGVCVCECVCVCVAVAVSMHVFLCIVSCYMCACFVSVCMLGFVCSFDRLFASLFTRHGLSIPLSECSCCSCVCLQEDERLGTDSFLGGSSSTSSGSTTATKTVCTGTSVQSCLTTTKVTASPDSTRTTTTAVLKVTPWGSKNAVGQSGCISTKLVCLTAKPASCAPPVVTKTASC
jgi:hypothetical protein